MSDAQEDLFALSEILAVDYRFLAIPPSVVPRDGRWREESEERAEDL